MGWSCGGFVDGECVGRGSGLVGGAHDEGAVGLVGLVGLWLGMVGFGRWMMRESCGGRWWSGGDRFGGDMTGL
jgi:hypothetical protein